MNKYNIGDYVILNDRYYKECCWYGDNNGIHYYHDTLLDNTFIIKKFYDDEYASIHPLNSNNSESCYLMELYYLKKINIKQLSIFDFLKQ